VRVRLSFPGGSEIRIIVAWFGVGGISKVGNYLINPHVLSLTINGTNLEAGR
jgi:hypothetical protein